MKINIWFVVSLFLVNITGCVSANSEEEQLKIAEESIQRQDYETAYSAILPLAEKGHPQQEFNLGLFYYRGLGVEKNYTKAREWWEKAANQNYITAQKALALMYVKGEGVLQNNDTAKEWLLKAAQLGDKDAQKLLEQLESGKLIPIQ